MIDHSGEDGGAWAVWYSEVFPMCRALLIALVVSSCFAQTSPPAIPPQKEVVVVTGTFEPIPLEEADRNVDVLTVRGERLLFDSFADYVKLDS